MASTKPTFCRICEPNCPITAVFDDDGALTGLVPDMAHPSGGIACHKGLSFLEIHNDPDRLNAPQKRMNPKHEERGDFAAVGWDAAMDEIGARLKAVRARHGKESVAVYLGNPFAFNAAGLMLAGEFQELLETPMRFSANTQDAANKFVVAREVYGSADAFMIPDIYNTDFLLCIGANPKVSRWTLMSAPNNWDVVKDIARRGGKVRFVNSRKTESSTVETGPTHLIRPATDVYFLAALLNEIDRQFGFDHAIVGRYGKNVDALRRFIARYPPSRVAKVTGIDDAAIVELARELGAAQSAAVYMSVGVHQSRQGVLACWLVEMINFVTGNLGRRGGTYKPTGLVDLCQPVAEPQKIETSIGSFELPDPIGYSVLPASVLPDLIEHGDIRALIVLGGNPLLSVGGGERAWRAFQKLELSIAVDIYRSATGEVCDFVLPGTDWLERADINLLGNGMQAIPYVQYSDAMEAPAAQRRNEWWILARLAQAIGLASPLDDDPAATDGAAALDAVLAARDLSIDTLSDMPTSTILFADQPREAVFDRCLQHPDGKIDCCPEAFAAGGLLQRCDAIFAELADEPEDVLKLISLRTAHLHNSWMGNSVIFRRGKNAENPLHMRSDDAASRDLFPGDGVRVGTANGAIDTVILIDDDLCPGTVAMSHGFGQERTFSLQIAQNNPGANSNALMPTGPGCYEPLSYMSWLSGIPVTVEPFTRDDAMARRYEQANAAE